MDAINLLNLPVCLHTTTFPSLKILKLFLGRRRSCTALGSTHVQVGAHKVDVLKTEVK